MSLLNLVSNYCLLYDEDLFSPLNIRKLLLWTSYACAQSSATSTEVVESLSETPKNSLDTVWWAAVSWWPCLSSGVGPPEDSLNLKHFLMYPKGDRAVPLFQWSVVPLASWENAIASRITHCLKFGSWWQKLWHKWSIPWRNLSSQTRRVSESALNFLVDENDTLYCSNLCIVRFLFPRCLKV